MDKALSLGFLLLFLLSTCLGMPGAKQGEVLFYIGFKDFHFKRASYANELTLHLMLSFLTEPSAIALNDQN